MDLDTYAYASPGDVVLRPEDEQAFREAEINLCGGIYSGGEDSFRGKIYSLLILDVTGIGLHMVAEARQLGLPVAWVLAEN